MTAHRSLSALLLPCLVASPASTQDRPAALARVPADWNNVVHVRDVVGTVLSYLRSERVQTLADGRQVPFGPDAMATTIEMLASSMPREVFAACPSDSFEQAGALIEAIMLQLAGERTEAAKIDGPSLKGWQERVAACLDKVGSPTGFVELGMPSKRTADRLFDDLIEWADDVAKRPRLAVRHADDSFELLMDGELDESALSLRLRVVLDGPSLRFFLGSFEGAGSTDRDLGPLWRDGSEQLLFVNLDARAGMRHFESMLETWYQMSDKTTEVVAGEDDEVWMLMSRLEQATEIDEAITVSLRVKDDLELITSSIVDDEDDWCAPPLASTDLEALLPPDAAWRYATSMLQFDEELFYEYDALLDLIGRTSSALSTIGEVTGPNNAMLDALDAAYVTLDETMLPVYDFISSERSQVFDDGFALVLGSGAKSTLSARVDGEVIGWHPGERGLPALALLGVPESKADGIEFIRRLSRALHESVDIDDAKVAEPTALDLGLGVTTLKIPLQRVTRSPLELGADLQPHWCVTDRLILFSTSVALSKQILNRRDSATRVRSADEVVTRGHITPARLIALTDDLRGAVTRLGGESAAELRRALDLGDLEPATQKAGAILDLARFAFSLAEHAEYTERWIDQRFDTHFVIR